MINESVTKKGGNIASWVMIQFYIHKIVCYVILEGQIGNFLVCVRFFHPSLYFACDVHFEEVVCMKKVEDHDVLFVLPKCLGFEIEYC
jgi:hypothetical protein